MAKPDVRFRAP